MILLDDLIALGGQLVQQGSAHSFVDCSYDSRLTRRGELFIALRTERADGHDYIHDAILAGAGGVLCTHPPPDPGNASVILAADPLALLQRWAAQHLHRVNPTVIAVTGSVGKTGTRRAIAAALATQGVVFQSRRSFNTLLGLPVALARLSEDARYAVLEFASDHPGEITRLSALFPPQVALITNVAEMHTRVFHSLAGITDEFVALLAPLPAGGRAVLNGDDPYLADLVAGTTLPISTFGRGTQCDLQASDVSYALAGVTMNLNWQGRRLVAHIPLLGEPGLYAALAAIAVALACGADLETSVAALAGLEPAAGRLCPLPGPNGSQLIDDSADAGLPAALAALQTIAQLPARRRIAVLGDLSALPAETDRAYRTLGALAGNTLDQLVCQGDGAALALQAARATRPDLVGTITHTADRTLDALPPDLGPGDLVLLCGGAAARLERVTARLLEQPTLALSPAGQAGVTQPIRRLTDRLVRQETAWRSVRIGSPGRPTWLRIDLDQLSHNIRRLRSLAGVPLMIVLKGDAYGHGAVRVARTAVAAGVQALAVATLGEARLLREAGVAAPMLILGYTPPWQAREVALLGVACTVYDDDGARALAAAGADLERPVAVHVKVDTGMARLGLPTADVGAFLARLRTMDGLQLEGLYTHFATADSANERFAHLQLTRFNRLLAELEQAALRPPLVHAANSAATLRFPEARFDMVRPGIACYGLSPGAETSLPGDLQPVLSFHSEIAQVRRYPAGTPISYGGTYVTQQPASIATIPVGYGDGVRRTPPWRAVLIHGQRAAIVGSICMDYLMADVTAIEGVRRGDAVVLIGRQGNQQISVDEVAGWLGTINYEVVVGILPRVPRETW